MNFEEVANTLPTDFMMPNFGDLKWTTFNGNCNSISTCGIGDMDNPPEAPGDQPPRSGHC